jgi:chromosome partitioning protein
MRIFCIANQKGGVGKTTTTVNLAAGLAQLGHRVLLVDLDPQGNATMGSGIDKRALEATVYDVLIGGTGIAEARLPSPHGGYHVLGANRELAGAEVELVSLDQRERRLKNALAAVNTEYDFVLIDCPPSLSLLTLNGLCSAHGVIVPMQCEYFALEGLSDLVNTIKQVHANLNRELEIIGLLRVMFDPRITLQQQVSEQLKAHFGDKVFNTVIPRNVRLAEAPSYGQPGVTFDPASKGAQAFVEFAREMAARLGSPARAAAPACMGLPKPQPSQLLSRIEDASLNASAPPSQWWIDGWLVRTLPGKARRARSVHALVPGVLPLAERLAAAEAACSRAGVPLIFRITPFSQPVDLPEALQPHGFVPVDPTLVLVAHSLPSGPAPAPPEPAPGTAGWRGLCRCRRRAAWITPRAPAKPRAAPGALAGALSRPGPAPAGRRPAPGLRSGGPRAAAGRPVRRVHAPRGPQSGPRPAAV